MEAKVNLCRVKVHCLSFKRRLWELTFWVTAVQNWRLSNKYHIFAFLFYEFQRPRLDFSGGSRWGARGASPLLIFRLKWGPNFFWVRPPPATPPYCIGHLIWPIAKRPIRSRERGYQDLGRDILSTLLTLIFSGSWSKKMIKGFEISLACITRVIFFTFLRRAKVI